MCKLSWVCFSIAKFIESIGTMSRSLFIFSLLVVYSLAVPVPQDAAAPAPAAPAEAAAGKLYIK